MMTRRQAIKTTALASAALATLPGAIAQTFSASPTNTAIVGGFTLPPLPYAYDALEPFIDAETMHIHHDKHHAAYVANLNKAFTILGDGPLATIETELIPRLRNLDSVPESIRTAVRNNGGGHYNHSLFWQMMKKDGGGEPAGELAKAIDASFGSFSTFKENFSKAALGQFGSGWAWLVLDRAALPLPKDVPDDRMIWKGGSALKIESTPNQDTLLSVNKLPLLGLDVWEHAYYLKYQNKRVDYIAAWFNVVNWDFVADRYAKSTA
jgi:Fe-Mn family superoxide dismutase